MINIPTFIKSRVEKTEQKIPKTIIQTYKTNSIPKAIYDNLVIILDKNPEYDYRLITDEEGIELIKIFFDERTLNAFLSLQFGAAKGDFLRYIILYLYGGVYLDLDASINLNLNMFIQPDDEFIFFIDGDINIEQFCFMISPRHIIMQKIIEEMINRIENKEKNIFLATGPTLVNDTIFNILNGTNIYNTKINVHPEERSKCYEKNNCFMNGKLHSRKDNILEALIVFKIKEVQENLNLIYENTDSLNYNIYDSSSNTLTLYSLF